jgi:TAT (twin-arginine translocation) pathway signal sequence
MLKRRNFLKAVGAATAAALVSRHPLVAEIAGDEDLALHFASDSMELQLSAGAPSS